MLSHIILKARLPIPCVKTMFGGSRLMKMQTFHWKQPLHNISSYHKLLYLSIHSNKIHTTTRTNAIPLIGPLLVKLTSPITRLVFLLLGRRFRKWWKTLSPQIQEKYMGRFMKNQNRLVIFVLGFTGFSLTYYLYHVEESPVTGRKRFMLLNNEQLEKIAEKQWKNINLDLDEVKLPVNSLLHAKVFQVAKRILVANQSKEVNALKWEVNVIDSDNVNAFVLANGQMFVFRGMLEAVANENELAGVLGHEMAHAILNHSGEQLSHAGFINLFSTALLSLLWAIVPNDGLAIIATWIHNTLEDVILTLPYSRKLEKEADEVGLMLAARACYDIRHVPLFWQRMHHQEIDLINQQTEWLSTHPSHENRVTWLRQWLPTALRLRSEFNCPELKRFLDASTKIYIEKYK